MKSFLVPIGWALLSTALCVGCCHFSGMPRHDLWIAGLVAGTVSLTAAVGAVLFARGRAG